ncbi:DUF5658 family protein [Salinigranum sp. GCM10025319]|uniref:DUF5658 family protein n=1 Tax=Salinigranum sp. GCM10025319 TaxID=3252687 RepID=UPI00361BFCEA
MKHIQLGDWGQEFRTYTRLDRLCESFVRHRTLVDCWLWVLVLVALVLDAHTTTVGLERGLVESNPVMRVAFSTFGVSVIWGLKAAVAGLALGCWAVLPRDDRMLVPASLGLPWALAVLSNTGLLVAV